ncbi:hypothetical protein FisN_29Lu103 [Fistulifera solaris]|uniref:Nudix hydrolase domain-containing protein n=1 Tax=Fistulifera solaris TaxID=1519565 RepID=A0A1Z5JLM1_FISSO|nr:hypothetical protein FisN_29Lu103 [Fistulifera solaris]|eukprot:GAX14884.1 hypothetical protein FisN_29Lu103 [Fistulifera solaris]
MGKCKSMMMILLVRHHSDGRASTSLQKFYPRLLELLNQLKDKDGVIPLLTTKQQDEMKARTIQVKPSDDRRRAAVLVLLCSVHDEPSILLTKRAAHLTNHAAEMAFVGGHYDDESDRSLMDTALREAHEELLPNPQLFSPSFRACVQILGECTPLPSLRGIPVTPVIAMLERPDLTLPLKDYFPGDPSEVDTVLAVSIRDLIQKETTHQLPDNPFRLVDAPVYPTPHGDVWGLTAYILRPLLRRIFRPTFAPEESSSTSV